MRAVVQKSPREVVVERGDDARVESSTDILMRVTSSATCGTDLHLYDGRMDATGMVIGHEPLGVVEEVGSAVVHVGVFFDDAPIHPLVIELDVAGVQDHSASPP